LTTCLQTTLNRRAGQTVKSERLEFVSPPQLTLRWCSLANSPKEAESGAVSADMTHRMVSTHPTAPMLTDGLVSRCIGKLASMTCTRAHSPSRELDLKSSGAAPRAVTVRN
jgi:hypothetical protein